MTGGIVRAELKIQVQNQRSAVIVAAFEGMRQEGL
jgi:hypothetical protein